MRFDPFKQIDRFTEQTFNGTGRNPTMAMDAFRQGETFQVAFDLPGVDAASIELTVERNVLTVKAERRRPEVEGAEYVVSERPYGSFSRQLFLGKSLDTDRIEARYDDGVLTLTMPVSHAARPRRIEVNAEAARTEAIPAESQPAEALV